MSLASPKPLPTVVSARQGLSVCAITVKVDYTPVVGYVGRSERSGYQCSLAG